MKRTVPVSFEEQSNQIKCSNKSYGNVFPVLRLPVDVQIYESITPTQCRACVQQILKRTGQSWSAWAFDIEWRVDFKVGGQRPVALMQFSRENIVILFHIHRCGLQPELIDILKNPKIFLLGVNISGDVKKIERDFATVLPGTIKGAVDLRELEWKLLSHRSSNSLAGMVQARLRMTLEKPQDVRTGNWEQNLTKEQKDYAALDVFSTYLLFHDIMKSVLANGSVKDSNQEGFETPQAISTFVFNTLSELSLKFISPSPVYAQPESICDAFDPSSSFLDRVVVCSCSSQKGRSPLSVGAATKSSCGPQQSLPSTSQTLSSFCIRCALRRERASSSVETVESIESWPHSSSRGAESAPDLGTQFNHIGTLGFLRAMVDIDGIRYRFDRIVQRRLMDQIRPDMKPLSVSKRACYDLFMITGLPFATVAEQRAIKESTVMGYILDTMADGYAYNFSRFGIPPSVVGWIVAAYVLCTLEDHASCTSASASSSPGVSTCFTSTSTHKRSEKKSSGIGGTAAGGTRAGREKGGPISLKRVASTVLALHRLLYPTNRDDIVPDSGIDGGEGPAQGRPALPYSSSEASCSVTVSDAPRQSIATCTTSYHSQSTSSYLSSSTSLATTSSSFTSTSTTSSSSPSTDSAQRSEDVAYEDEFDMRINTSLLQRIRRVAVCPSALPPLLDPATAMGKPSLPMSTHCSDKENLPGQCRASHQCGMVDMVNDNATVVNDGDLSPNEICFTNMSLVSSSVSLPSSPPDVLRQANESLGGVAHVTTAAHPLQPFPSLSGGSGGTASVDVSVTVPPTAAAATTTTAGTVTAAAAATAVAAAAPGLVPLTAPCPSLALLQSSHTINSEALLQSLDTAHQEQLFWHIRVVDVHARRVLGEDWAAETIRQFNQIRAAASSHFDSPATAIGVEACSGLAKAQQDMKAHVPPHVDDNDDLAEYLV